MTDKNRNCVRQNFSELHHEPLSTLHNWPEKGKKSSLTCCCLKNHIFLQNSFINESVILGIHEHNVF